MVSLALKYMDLRCVCTDTLSSSSAHQVVQHNWDDAGAYPVTLVRMGLQTDFSLTFRLDARRSEYI